MRYVPTPCISKGACCSGERNQYSHTLCASSNHAGVDVLSLRYMFYISNYCDCKVVHPFWYYCSNVVRAVPRRSMLKESCSNPYVLQGISWVISSAGIGVRLVDVPVDPLGQCSHLATRTIPLQFEADLISIRSSAGHAPRHVVRYM